VRASEDVLLEMRPNGRLFHRHQKMAAALEADEASTGNRGSRELRVAIELEGVVFRMQDERRCLDGRKPLIGQGGLIVEPHAAARSDTGFMQSMTSSASRR
jgi:hypothetical protein